jgi:hypothetical protein
MSRVAIDEFGDREIARIDLAARLAEAQRVEAELNKHNIEYAVEVESYAVTAVLWISEYAGAAFYVPAEQVDRCCGILRQVGLCAGLMEERDR